MKQARTISFRLLFTLIRFTNVFAIDRKRRLIAKTFMKRISAINRRVRSIAALAINRKAFFVKRGPGPRFTKLLNQSYDRLIDRTID